MTVSSTIYLCRYKIAAKPPKAKTAPATRKGCLAVATFAHCKALAIVSLVFSFDFIKSWRDFSAKWRSWSSVFLAALLALAVASSIDPGAIPAAFDNELSLRELSPMLDIQSP